jgi:hypothetical protein
VVAEKYLKDASKMPKMGLAVTLLTPNIYFFHKQIFILVCIIQYKYIILLGVPAKAIFGPKR